MEFLKEGVAPVSAGNEPHAQQMRVIIVNFLEHHALVQGNDGSDPAVDQNAPQRALRRDEAAVPQAATNGAGTTDAKPCRLRHGHSERWKLVTVDKVGKRRRGNTNASEVWRSAKIAADLEQYLKWLFRKHHADDNRIDYLLRKRRQHGHKGYGYDIG